VPFTQTITIPIPKMPDVTYVGSEGEPFSSAFRLNFQVTNPNSFPFTLTSVKTFLEISGKKYSLLHTRKSTDFQPGETQPVVLQMENSPGKTLIMALNLAADPHPTFNITGTVTFSTPYGWIFIPLSLEETLQ
jgi:LEA14-like dessication related protein